MLPLTLLLSVQILFLCFCLITALFVCFSAQRSNSGVEPFKRFFSFVFSIKKCLKISVVAKLTDENGVKSMLQKTSEH